MSANIRSTQFRGFAVTEEIGAQAARLAELSREHGLEMMTYLLDMVVLESRQLARATAMSPGDGCGRPSDPAPAATAR